MVRSLGGLLPQAELRLEVALHLSTIQLVQHVQVVKLFMHLAVRTVQQLVCHALQLQYLEHAQFQQLRL